MPRNPTTVDKFNVARDAAMRGARLAAEGDSEGAYAAITAIASATEEASDALDAEREAA